MLKHSMLFYSSLLSSTLCRPERFSSFSHLRYLHKRSRDFTTSRPNSSGVVKKKVKELRVPSLQSKTDKENEQADTEESEESQQVFNESLPHLVLKFDIVQYPMKTQEVYKFHERELRLATNSTAGIHCNSSTRQPRVKWSELVDIAGNAFEEHGDACSERVYQDAMFYALYRRGIPCIRERPLYVLNSGYSVHKGRVDLEIASQFILELKVCSATERNITRDKKQLRRYLRAYQQNGQSIERAAIIYFSNHQVRVVEVSMLNKTEGRFTPY